MHRLLKLEKFLLNKTVRQWFKILAVALGITAVFRTWFYAPYRIPTGSMIHTIEIGDHLLVNKHAYGFRIPFTRFKLFSSSIKRGDIVVFPYPKDKEVDFIKRAIAIGGDELVIDGERIYINGILENGGYLFYDKSRLPLPEQIKIKVPEGKIWVMGDNRGNSQDSRYWGFVNEKDVEGKAAIIYWSHDPKQNLINGYRFNRIGTLIK